MKVILGLTVLLAVVCPISGDRYPKQGVVPYCTKKALSNQLEFDFRVVLNGDPQGTMAALDTNSNEVTNNNFCSINYDSNNGVYSFTSMVNLGNNGGTNGCGYSVQGVGNDQLISWRVAYYEFPNQKAISAGLNRVYTMVCNMSEVLEDRLLASITVSTPNINQNVANQVPLIQLNILYRTLSGGFAVATPSTEVQLDTLIKLQLTVNHGGYDQNKIYGVAGKRTEVAGNGAFTGTVIELLNVNGCPSNQQFAPGIGFVSTSTNSNTNYISQTGEFRVWQIGNSNTLIFRVTVDPCRWQTYNGNPKCLNVCANPNGRRRRDAEDGEVELPNAVASIRIFKPSANQHDLQTSDDSTMIYVGMGVAVGVSIILLAIVVFIVASRRRRLREDKKPKKIEEFSNNPNY